MIENPAPRPALPLVRDGKLRAFAVTSAQCEGALPKVPALAEAGFPDLVYEGWCELWAPRGLPAEMVSRVNQAVNAASNDPATVARILPQ